jgi:hypothetical protein
VTGLIFLFYFILFFLIGTDQRARKKMEHRGREEEKTPIDRCQHKSRMAKPRDDTDVLFHIFWSAGRPGEWHRPAYLA